MENITNIVKYISGKSAIPFMTYVNCILVIPLGLCTRQITKTKIIVYYVMYILTVIKHFQNTNFASSYCYIWDWDILLEYMKCEGEVSVDLVRCKTSEVLADVLSPWISVLSRAIPGDQDYHNTIVFPSPKLRPSHPRLPLARPGYQCPHFLPSLLARIIKSRQKNK